MTFDIQRFADEDEQSTTSVEPEQEQEQTAEDEESLPEELSGLPKEYAREVLEQSQPAENAPQSAPAAPQTVSQEQYQAAINEANQLKAQLAQYQRQQQPPPQQQPQQAPQFQPPQLKLTPEISKQISAAIKAEAMAMSGFSDDDVASLDYADDDDPRIEQWNQAKNIATNRVYGAIQAVQAQQVQQAQKFYNAQTSAIRTYNEFAQKEFAEPDFQAIQHFATNEFFEQLKPAEQQIVANSYFRVERQLASPAEMLVVKNYYERAKAAFRSRGGRSKRSPNQGKTIPPQFPRSDQLRGGSTTNDGALSTSDIERLLAGDFTKISPKQQKILLGMS